MARDPFHQVEVRFYFNIERVRSLIAIFDELKESPRKKSYVEDVLRSAVVLLHASLEDLLRGLIGWRCMNDPEFLYDKLEFALEGSKSQSKITVRDVSQWRDKTVQELIDAAVERHLSHRSFNNTADIAQAFPHLGVEGDEFKVEFAELDEAVSRRHKIVHQSDRPNRNISDHGKPSVIEKTDVEKWRVAVSSFGMRLINALRPEGLSPAPILRRPPPPKKTLTLARARHRARAGSVA